MELQYSTVSEQSSLSSMVAAGVGASVGSASGGSGWGGMRGVGSMQLSYTITCAEANGQQSRVTSGRFDAVVAVLDSRCACGISVDRGSGVSKKRL